MLSLEGKEYFTRNYERLFEFHHRVGKRELRLEQIYLDVFDNNIHAIQFYKKNHFIEVGRIALVKETCETESRWKTAPQLNPDIADRCYINMKLEHNES